MLHFGSVRMRRFAIAMIVAICIGSPIVETFDQWDHTLQDGNDTEANLVIVALCVGVALSFARFVVARVRAFLSSARSSPAVSHPAILFSSSRRARPIPNSRPPTPLRV